MLSDKITSFFFFLKEDKVAFNEKKKQMDTLKYLSIIIKKHKHQHIYRNDMTFREM